MNDRIGQQLGNYRLVALLGRGSYAEVYLGQHVRLHLQAAIKLLHTHLTGNEAEHFQHEAQTIATLAHPAIVRVFDFDVQDDIPFLVMDYAPNGSLRQRYPKGSVVPLPQILSFAKQVASALQYAHEQKVIHRDVKPENMLLGRQEEVLLSDFGIATVAHNTVSLSAQAAVGTIAYMAPEQLQGQPHPASDQYALAVTVYEWLCGARPFEGSIPELVTQHLWQSPPPLQSRAPTISSEVEQVVLRALAKDPKSRFAGVQDFALALERACSASRVFSAPSRGEATVAADPSGLALLQNQLSAQLSPADEPQVDRTPASERNASLPTTPAGPVHARPLWKVPTSLTSFIGREQDVEAITALLMRQDVHLLTLTGTGGVGKTRLSLQVAAELADRFADGVCFVNLAPLSDAELVVPAIAKTLGLWETGDRPISDHVRDYLREKHLLLLLDNFEQVAAASPQLAALLVSCPHLRLLVTSRAPLHLSGEYEFPVPPLTTPDLTQLPEQQALAQVAAVQLFVERAHAIQPTFQLTQANARTIAEICVRLDGLPLVIELAAARIKLLPPQALLLRLSHRLDLLTGGARDLPTRQQTLRNTLQWSYDLLSLQEQRLFRRLSVFVGGFSLEAATAVVQATGHANDEDGASLPQLLDNVASLLDKSLVQQTEQEGEEPRLLMLETTREYGLESLQAHRELEAAQAAHAAYYLHLVEEAHRHLFSVEATWWFERLEQEYANIRAALQWALEHEDEEGGSGIETAVRLGSALCRFWTVRGHLSEGRTLLEQVFTKSLRSTASVRAQAIYALAILVWFQGDYVRAEQLASAGLLLGRQLGTQRFMAAALFALAGVALYQRNYPAAHSLGTEALAVARARGETWWMANILFLLGRLASAQGDQSRAQPLLEEGLALYRTLGYQGDIGWPLIYLARNCITQGDLARARTLLEEAMTLCQEGDYKWGQAQAIGFLGQVTLAQGDVSAAHALFTESLRLNQELGNQHSVAWSLFHLASTVGLQGDTTTARSLYRQGLDLALALRYQRLIVACLEGLAIVATAQGQLIQAARLWGAAEVFLQESGVALPTGLRPYSEQAQASARAQLGEAAFDAALADGRTCSLEQVLELPTPITPPDTAGRPGAESLSPLPAPSIRRTASYPAGLTAREVEVLRLVAQGLTSAQIAEQLVIGVVTVNFHVRSIYSKLGVSSRSAATRYAIEHHLV